MSIWYPEPKLVLYNPKIPLWKDIPGGLKIGSLIVVKGRIPYGCKRLTLNFATKEAVDGDIGFHFDVRFEHNCIVRNSQIKTVWGKEEKDCRNPIAPGQFEIMVLVDESGFQAAVNGKHFATFKHRLPIASLGFLNIIGDMNILVNSVEFRKDPTLHEFENVAKNLAVPTVYNPKIPFCYTFHSGLTAGQMIYVSGRPTSNASGFCLNFLNRPNADIAFHFNPRFANGSVVRNSRLSNVWGVEEIDTPKFPFTPAVNFDIVVRVMSDCFMVAVNGQHLIEFKHRGVPLAAIKLFEIEGHVAVNSIKFAD